MSIKKYAMAVAVIAGILGITSTADAQRLRRGGGYYGGYSGAYYPSSYYPSSGVVYSSGYDAYPSTGVVAVSGYEPSYSSGVVTGAYSPYTTSYYDGYYGSPYYSGGYASPWVGTGTSGVILGGWRRGRW